MNRALGKQRKKIQLFKVLRRWGRGIFYLNTRVAATLGIVALLLLGITTSTLYHRIMTPAIDPTVYKPLLATIAKGESDGNYNAYYGNAGNTDVQFTHMTIAEILAWQESYVRQGSPSSAVGKYQIIRPTLAALVDKLKLDQSTKFDEHLQDTLAVALLEKRGAAEYMDDKLSRDQFAANLAKEWAALPKVTGDNPDQSYYAGDGLNKVRISVAEVYKALALIKS